ncbi:UNVERIFIED_CONTAM: DUF4162 domain-containing protein [Campylobacter lari]
MEEADNCDYAIIINKGKKLAEGTPSDLKNNYSNTQIVIYKNEYENIENILKKYDYKYENSRFIVEFENYANAKNFLESNLDIIKDYEIKKGTMDDVFLTVTKNEGGNNA